MSSRAIRLTGEVGCQPFDWANGGPRPPRPFGPGGEAPAAPAAARAPEAPTSAGVDLALVERDAFAQGFAQGERSGVEAAAARSAGVLKRLAQTIEELSSLRADILRRTEREVVVLALAIAKRIVHREIALDADLLTAMARVALDRMGDAANATIRLHPDDYAATSGGRGISAPEMGAVRIVADPAVRRGGCHVQSDFGLIDVNADAQIAELATVLLGTEDGAASLVGVPIEARLAS